jgi:hypothetical protein
MNNGQQNASPANTSQAMSRRKQAMWQSRSVMQSGGNMNTPPYDELKSLTRKRLRLLWQQANLGGTFSGEDAHFVQAMREHLEYADLWGHLDELSDEQIERDGTNPILHINIHTTIENQLAMGQPAEIGQAIEGLMQQGLSRHEAIHRVGTALADEIFHILKDERPFDEAGFVRKLQRLVKPPMPHPLKTSRPSRRRAKGRYR